MSANSGPGLAGGPFIGTQGTNLTLSGTLTVGGAAALNNGATITVLPLVVSGAPAGLTAGSAVQMGSYNAATAGALWLNPVVPSAVNYTLLGTTTGASLNAPAGQSINFQFGAATQASVDSTGGLHTGAATLPDFTGTPGNAVSNTPRGRAALAALATTCTITNSLCTANAVVCVTWESDMTGARWWVVHNAGNFVVTVSGAPAGNVNFRWVVFQ